MILEKDNLLDQSKLNNLKFFLIFLNLFLSLIQLHLNEFKISFLIIILFLNIINIIICNIIFNKENLYFFLFPCIILFFSNFYYLFSPLIIKLLYFESIFINLNNPYESFRIILFYQLAIILSFKVFKLHYLNNDKRKFILVDMLKLNIFSNYNKIENRRLFLILFGIKCYIVFLDTGSLYATDFGDISMKILYGFERLYFLPILTTLNLFLIKKISKQEFIIFFLIYTFSVIFFALLTNSRTELFSYLFFVIIILISISLTNKILLEKLLSVRSLLIFIIILIFLNFFSQTVLESRTYRSDLTPIELLNKYNRGVDKNFEKQNNNSIIGPEDYVQNNVLNRITSIKFFDKSLYEYSYFDVINKLEFKSFTYNRILAIIPQNLINIFNKDYKKIEYQIATGSYLEQKLNFRQTGDLNTGSYLVELYNLNNSYILSFIAIFIIFYLSFYILSNFQNMEKNKITYSPLIFILFLIFNKLTISDNLLAIISNLIRSPLEIIILNFFLYLIVKKKLNYLDEINTNK
jgi:hypothetical protein